jgi:hypothetical protein
LEAARKALEEKENVIRQRQLELEKEEMEAEYKVSYFKQKENFMF